MKVAESSSSPLSATTCKKNSIHEYEKSNCNLNSLKHKTTSFGFHRNTTAILTLVLDDHKMVNYTYKR